MKLSLVFFLTKTTDKMQTTFIHPGNKVSDKRCK